MYSSSDRKSRRILTFAITVVIVAVLAVAAVFLSGNALEQSRLQGAESVRQAIINAAVQCAAVEGGYPFTIEYLEENYGLQVNRDDYVITYEAFATNIMPSIVVVPR